MPIIAKLYSYAAQLLIRMKKYGDACEYIDKSIVVDLKYYGKYMDWTHTNVIIKSIPAKKRKMLNKWHGKVKGLHVSKK